MKERRIITTAVVCCATITFSILPEIQAQRARRGERVEHAGIGREVSMARHLVNGEEYSMDLSDVLAHGEALFAAMWTSQEGGGRPLTKGTGGPLADLTQPLTFPRNFNRVSAPDANSCAGCHNLPFGLPGGGGDIVANVFVTGQRFDFATFDIANDILPTKGAVDERGQATTLQGIANSRATLGMFGSGYIEMLARQMTEDLQAIRDAIPPGGEAALHSKGVMFGALRRGADGSWDVSAVEGVPSFSLKTTGPDAPPDLVIRPFHQVGRVVSLREFSNNAFNHHHGIQTQERFGRGADPDGDGFRDEMTDGDVTAVSLFQAAMAVPGRVIPNDPEVEAAVWNGEQQFAAIGCAECHRESLPLDRNGWLFSEPNPYNPPGNLRPGELPEFLMDLTDRRLPLPRLEPSRDGVVDVPAYTDLKLHDITDGPNDPNREPIDMQEPGGSTGFFEGNGKFLTKKLWGCANEPPYFHHGQFTTLRQAVMAHGGEASAIRAAFLQLAPYDQDSIIEFLKSLQILPPGTRDLVVDERGVRKQWPPRGQFAGRRGESGRSRGERGQGTGRRRQ